MNNRKGFHWEPLEKWFKIKWFKYIFSPSSIVDSPELDPRPRCPSSALDRVKLTLVIMFLLFKFHLFPYDSYDSHFIRFLYLNMHYNSLYSLYILYNWTQHIVINWTRKKVAYEITKNWLVRTRIIDKNSLKWGPFTSKEVTFTQFWCQSMTLFRYNKL